MKNRKIISIIPNLLTSIALLLGLLSIFNLVSENSYNSIWWSCVFIYSAAFIDFIDGKIARLLKNDSEFGMHYDSLADLISFGVAPSFLVYSLYLNSFDRLGIICCLFYTICVALRLARFNTLAHDEKDGFFIGMPSPMAAGLIVSFVLINFKFEILPSNDLSLVLLFSLIFVGYLMVSNVIFIKKITIKGLSKFNSLVLITFLLIAILAHIEIGSLIFFSLYLFLSLIKYLLFKLKRRNLKFKN